MNEREIAQLLQEANAPGDEGHFLGSRGVLGDEHACLVVAPDRNDAMPENAEGSET